MVAAKGKPTGLGVTTERFRYLEHQDGSVELFDVKTDPREWVNLVGQVERAETLAQLKRLAAAHRERFWK
jgi:hypothetical protein